MFGTKFTGSAVGEIKKNLRYISKIFYVDNEHKIYNLHDVDKNTLYLI